MKFKHTLLFGAFALTLTSANAATKTFIITGSSAFRAAANAAILQMLGGQGTAKYSYAVSSASYGLDDSTRATFEGSNAAFPGDTILVKTSWSGSGAGVDAIAKGTLVQTIVDSYSRTVAGNQLVISGTTNLETNVAASIAFSDVDKSITTAASAAVTGNQVGVVPFMFVAGEGAPAGLTNMSDQMHENLWKNGFAKSHMLTGNSSDTGFAYATGRSSSSGTRLSILAETRYGAFTSVKQYSPGSLTGTSPNGSYSTTPALTSGGNGGQSDSLAVRTQLTNTPKSGTYFVSYLGVSDATQATGYNPTTGNSTGGEGARALTYNGVRYSEDNVKNGSYSLWAYQNMYLKSSPTADETLLESTLRGLIPDQAVTTGAGIKAADLKVKRTTVTTDGSLIIIK